MDINPEKFVSRVERHDDNRWALNWRVRPEVMKQAAIRSLAGTFILLS